MPINKQFSSNEHDGKNEYLEKFIRFKRNKNLDEERFNLKRTCYELNFELAIVKIFKRWENR